MTDLWRHRAFIWDAAVADLRYRYAGSSLGVLWNVLTPLAMLALYTIIFTGFMAPRFGEAGLSSVKFVLYLSSGFLPWIAFSDGLVRSSQALVAKATYLKRMPVPEQVFIAQASLSAMLVMFISVALLIGLALVLGQPPLLSWLLLPAVVCCWQLFGFGMSLTLATINVFFRDVAQALTVLFQIWMWSLPVIYIEDVLPSFYHRLLALNPGYPFVRAFRAAYFGEVSVDPVLLVSMVAWIAVALAVGFLVVRGLRPDVRDAL
jgi:ABC-type polysaccharide/polyol phosphate export permease